MHALYLLSAILGAHCVTAQSPPGVSVTRALGFDPSSQQPQECNACSLDASDPVAAISSSLFNSSTSCFQPICFYDAFNQAAAGVQGYIVGICPESLYEADAGFDLAISPAIYDYFGHYASDGGSAQLEEIAYAFGTC